MCGIPAEHPPGCQCDPGSSSLTSQELQSHHLSPALARQMFGETTCFSNRGRHDRAGQQRRSKTKSHISQTLYQSNILEAQSHTHRSHRLQRKICEGFFLSFWTRGRCGAAAVIIVRRCNLRCYYNRCACTIIDLIYMETRRREINPLLLSFLRWWLTHKHREEVRPFQIWIRQHIAEHI